MQAAAQHSDYGRRVLSRPAGNREKGHFGLPMSASFWQWHMSAELRTGSASLGLTWAGKPAPKRHGHADHDSSFG